MQFDQPFSRSAFSANPLLAGSFKIKKLLYIYFTKTAATNIKIYRQAENRIHEKYNKYK